MVLDIGWDAMIVADPRSSAFERRRGETVAAISAALGRDPFDVYFDLVESSHGQAQFVNVGYGGDLEDDGPMQRILARPDAMPGDGHRPRAGGERGRARLAAALLRIDGAVHRPLLARPRPRAARAGGGADHARPGGAGAAPGPGTAARRRGFADVTVFDPAEIGERGTTLEPEPAGGIPYVFVNGEPVVHDGVYDPARRAGRALRLGR